MERTEEEQKAYREGYEAGLKEGVRKYAWWKDGEQWVGTCGTRLKEAIKRIETEMEV